MKELPLLLLVLWMDKEGARAMQGKQTNSVTAAGVVREAFFQYMRKFKVNNKMW